MRARRTHSAGRRGHAQSRRQAPAGNDGPGRGGGTGVTPGTPGAVMPGSPGDSGCGVSADAGTRADAPDRDIAKVAARLGVVEAIVVIDEVALQRRHIGGTHEIDAVALQAVHIGRAALCEAGGKRRILCHAQLLARRPQEAAAGVAVEPAARVVAVADCEAAVAVAQRRGKADGVLIGREIPCRPCGGRRVAQDAARTVFGQRGEIECAARRGALGEQHMALDRRTRSWRSRSCSDLVGP